MQPFHVVLRHHHDGSDLLYVYVIYHQPKPVTFHTVGDYSDDGVHNLSPRWCRGAYYIELEEKEYILVSIITNDVVCCCFQQSYTNSKF